MERPSLCPKCLSQHSDIKGLIYKDGNPVGTQCADDWHRGADYHPEVLDLTQEDRKFLAAQYIRIW